MQERFAGAPASDGQGEAYEIGALIGAKDLAPGFGGDYEQGDWDYVYVLGLPDFAFYLDAGLEFFDAVAVADGDVVIRNVCLLIGGRKPANREIGAPRASLA